MSNPMESTTGQLNMPNDASATNASTASHQTDDIFINHPVSDQDITITKNKKQRSRNQKYQWESKRGTKSGYSIERN